MGKVVWDDVTKQFPFHKYVAISTNLPDSLEHWNIK